MDEFRHDITQYCHRCCSWWIARRYLIGDVFWCSFKTTATTRICQISTTMNLLSTNVQLSMSVLVQLNGKMISVSSVIFFWYSINSRLGWDSHFTETETMYHQWIMSGFRNQRWISRIFFLYNTNNKICYFSPYPKKMLIKRGFSSEMTQAAYTLYGFDCVCGDIT